MKQIEWKQNNTQLYITDRLCTELTTSIAYTQLRKLVIRAENVTTISSRLFHQTRNLRYLKLDLPNLLQLPNDLFHDLRQLRTLIIAVTKCLQLPKQMLIYNFALEKLQVLSKSTFLHAVTISFLWNLRVLDIRSENNNAVYLYDANKTFFGYRHLTTLRLQIYHTIFFQNYAQITRLNLAHSLNIKLQWLADFDSLRFLNLNRTFSNLDTLRFHRNQQLRTLILSYNNLSALPSSLLAHLRHLTYLDLRKCNLQSFHLIDFVGHCPNLFYVSLRDNLLTYQSFCAGLVFAGLRYLQKLDLSFNRLESLPAGGLFDDLVDLKCLLLNNNALIDLPTKCFARLQHLRLLDLSENFLIDLNWRWFDPRSRYALEHFDMHLNRVCHVPKKCFRGFDSLKCLNLAFNQIALLTRANFAYLPQLRKLNLSFNRIAVLNAKHFRNLHYLEYLNLRDNEIVVIRARTFVQFRYLKALNLKNNPISNISLKNLMFRKQLTLFAID